MHRSMGNNVQQIWMRSAKWGHNGDLDSFHEAGVFFVVKTRRFFGNFPTADFHRIWPLHVNQCPLEMYWNGFRKLFVYGSFAQKTSKLTGVEQTPYSDQPAHGTHCRLCLLGVVVQGLRSFSGLWSTFLYDVCTLWGQSSSFSNFRIFA